MLPNLFHLSNTPVGTTSAHCANHFERKWDKLAESIARRHPCDPTDASDPHNRAVAACTPKVWQTHVSTQMPMPTQENPLST